MPIIATEPLTPHKVLSLTERWSPSSCEATVVYRTFWDQRFALENELMGGYPPSAAGFSDYRPPLRYPPSPNLYCQEIAQVEGKGRKKRGSGSKWSPYTLADITVVYRTPSFDVETPTPAGQIDTDNPILFCRQRIRASAAFKILPKGKIIFETSSKVVDQEVSKPCAQSEVTLEFPRVPFNPYGICRPYLGKLNTVTMFKAPAGCVLFDSIDTDESATSAGLDCGAVLTFLIRDASWNTLVNDDGEDELVKFDTSGATKRPFESVDLFEMFVSA